MRTWVTWSITAVLLAGVATPLAAQREVRRNGFWIGFGLGGGWNTTQNVNNQALAGGSGYLRLGGTPSERLLLGGEVNVWVRSENDVTLSRGNATLTVLFYPSRSGGLFLKGGVGGASVQSSFTSGSVTTTVSDQGLGTTFGVGYDFRLGRNFNITPNADFLFQSINDVENTLVLFSVGVTWH